MGKRKNADFDAQIREQERDRVFKVSLETYKPRFVPCCANCSNLNYSVVVYDYGERGEVEGAMCGITSRSIECITGVCDVWKDKQAVKDGVA